MNAGSRMMCQASAAQQRAAKGKADKNLFARQVTLIIDNQRNINWFFLCSETQLKTTIIRKWNPCRAARQREVFNAAALLAARSVQNATDRTERGSEHPSTENQIV